MYVFSPLHQTNRVIKKRGGELRGQIHVSLTAHNWQKWKRVFLTCPCHDIYRVEAVGLKSSNYTLKIVIFANM